MGSIPAVMSSSEIVLVVDLGEEWKVQSSIVEKSGRPLQLGGSSAKPTDLK